MRLAGRVAFPFMPPQVCALCREAPASVFTADHPVCVPCFRELRRAEQVDNGIANFEPCVQCQGDHGGHGCMSRGVLVVAS